MGTTTTAAAGTVTTFGGMTIATTTASTASATGVTTYTTTGFMVNAALTSLATQASISAVNNGGNPTKILQDLGSKDSIKGLLTSVVTAGLMDKIGGAAWMDKLNNAGTQIGISEKIITGLVNSTGSALVSTSINGGSLSDNLQAALLSGLATAVQGQLANKIGISLDNNTGTNLEYVLHKIAHAAAGCVAGVIQKQCEAGAIGAVVGEVIADLVPQSKPLNEMTQAEHEAYNNKVLGVAQILAGTVSAYAGYDVNIAVSSADIAVRNNFLYPKEKARFEIEYTGCSVKNNAATCRDQVVSDYMKLSKQNDQTLINTCNNKAQISECYSMLKVALDYSGSDYWYGVPFTSSAALNALKSDQIRTRDLVLSNIFKSPDTFYKAINDIDARADFFSAMYTKTGAKWFKLAENVSRNDLQGGLFLMGDTYNTVVSSISFETLAKYDKSLYDWRKEAGDSIMALGYNDFKNIYQNYDKINIDQWNKQRLGNEQVALQSIHEKYLPKFAPLIEFMMNKKGKLNNILDTQQRIDKGCIEMGYNTKCYILK